MIGERLAELVCEDDREAVNRCITEKGDACSFDFRITGRDDRWLHAEPMNLSNDAPGEQVRLGIIDISSRKQLEQESESNRARATHQSRLAAIGQMIGAVSHQWKQPLNIISLYAQDLRMRVQNGDITPSHFDERLGQILSQVHEMDKLLRDFKNFFSPTRKPERFNIIDALESVLSMMHVLFVKENIVVEHDFDAARENYACTGFQSEIKQVFLNVIDNAIDVLDGDGGDGPGKLYIRASIKGSDIQVVFHDSGPGVDEELRSKVFDEYFTSKGDSGTGIGLSFSRDIIRRMGGDLTLEPSRHGARFVMRMPCE